MEGLQDVLRDGSVEVASAAKSFVKAPCELGTKAHTVIPVLRKVRLVLISRSSRTRGIVQARLGYSESPNKPTKRHSVIFNFTR